MNGCIPTYLMAFASCPTSSYIEISRNEIRIPANYGGAIELDRGGLSLWRVAMRISLVLRRRRVGIVHEIEEGLVP